MSVIVTVPLRVSRYPTNNYVGMLFVFKFQKYRANQWRKFLALITFASDSHLWIAYDSRTGRYLCTFDQCPWNRRTIRGLNLVACYSLSKCVFKYAAKIANVFTCYLLSTIFEEGRYLRAKYEYLSCSEKITLAKLCNMVT